MQRSTVLMVVAALLASSCAGSFTVPGDDSTAASPATSSPVTEPAVVADAPAQSSTLSTGASPPAAPSEFAQWDALVVAKYTEAGGFGRPVHEFEVALNGKCLGIIANDQTEWMFPNNPALGKAVRDFNDDDCEKQVLGDPRGSSPTDATTLDDMISERFARAVSWATTRSEFEALAAAMCSGATPTEAFETQSPLSNSMQEELLGIPQSGECSLLNPATSSTTETEVRTPPAIDPSGLIVFTSKRDGDYELFRMASDGQETTQITRNTESDGAGGVGGSASVSPDGTRIAFTRAVGLGMGDIFVVDIDGLNEVRITNNLDSDADPLWSPDGQQLLIHRASMDGRGLYLASPDRTGDTQLVIPGEGHLSPYSGLKNMSAWTPDGQSVLYRGWIDYGPSIDLVALDGSGSQHLTTTVPTPYIDLSPDGRLVVFSDSAEEFADESGLFLLGTDGSAATPLTEVAGKETQPAFSPDGKWIAFVNRLPEGPSALYVSSLDGSNVRQLTPTAGDERVGSFIWSPDSAALLLSYSPDASSESETSLMIVDLAGALRETGQTGTPIGWN